MKQESHVCACGARAAAAAPRRGLQLHPARVPTTAAAAAWPPLPPSVCRPSRKVQRPPLKSSTATRSLVPCGRWPSDASEKRRGAKRSAPPAERWA
jgi:hypothetical protein